MKKSIVGVVAASLLMLSCATVSQQIGKVALKVMTKKEADLSKIAAIGKYQSNIYSPEVGITTLGTEDWQEGDNLVGVQFVKPEGSIGVIALDGTVTVGGQEAKHYGGGAFFAAFPNSDKSPKKVVITSTNGSTTEFEIAPLPTISIKNINGKASDATIDVTQPLTIELEYDAAAEGKRVLVSLITKAPGAKGFAYFQSTLIKGKISVPAAAFQHKHIAGGGPTGKDVTNWATGENSLQVSIVENDRSVADQPFAYFKKEITSFDTVPVTVTGNAEGRAWVSVKGKSDEANGEFGYDASASNAWYARPLNSNIKRIGIGSINVSGTLYKKEVETSESESYGYGYAGYGKYTTITTTTTTFEFPQLDDAYWNQFLENLYSDLTGTLENEYNAQIVDVDEITANPIYDDFYTPDDENTQKYISKNLRDTKQLIPLKLGEILGDRTTALIADNGTMPRLLRDMNLDAVMSININYQVAADENDKIVLLPNVSFRVDGQTQAFDGNSNTWLQGNVRGPGVPFDRSEFTDLNALNRIGQKDVIVELVRRAMKELTEEQSKFGYDTVWNTALEK